MIIYEYARYYAHSNIQCTTSHVHYDMNDFFFVFIRQTMNQLSQATAKTLWQIENVKL